MYYEDVERELKTMMEDIAKRLRIEGEEKQLFKQLLKVIQDNNERIFHPDSKKYVSIWTSLDSELENNEDLEKLFEDYHKLVIYMLLQ